MPKHKFRATYIALLLNHVNDIHAVLCLFLSMIDPRVSDSPSQPFGVAGMASLGVSAMTTVSLRRSLVH